MGDTPANSAFMGEIADGDSDLVEFLQMALGSLRARSSSIVLLMEQRLGTGEPTRRPLHSC